jgi:YggT family protein
MGFFIEIVIFFLRVYIGLIIIRVIISWLRLNLTGLLNKVNKFLFDITEPFLIIFRKIIPLVRTGRVYIDLSYIVAIILIELLIILLQYIRVRFM